MNIIFSKNLLENKEMVFKKYIKNIQAAAYNGPHTVDELGKAYRPEGIHKSVQ